MKRLLIGFLFSLTSICSAEQIAVNLRSVSVANFVQVTYKGMLKRDFVLSPEVLAMEKLISVSVRQMDSASLPSFIDRILLSQGVHSVQRDGVYYLSSDLNQEGAVIGGRPFPLSGAIQQPSRSGDPLFDAGVVSGLHGVSASQLQRDVGGDEEREVYRPLFRDANFIATAVNLAYLNKPATIAGGVIILSAPKENLIKLFDLVRSIDVQANKVRVSATFVEVSTNAATALGVSVVANVLGVKLGMRLGETSSGSLTLNGNNFQAVLDALSSDGRFKQVSNPTALVDDYEKSSISFGDSVPTIASTTLDKNGNPIQQVVYQQSGVLLDVTPRVLGSGQIKLTVDGQVSSFSATTTGVTSSPTLSKRQVQTSLTLADGEILLIGGLNSNKRVNGQTGFSFLPKSWSVKNESAASTDLVLILSASVVK